MTWGLPLYLPTEINPAKSFMPAPRSACLRRVTAPLMVVSETLAPCQTSSLACSWSKLTARRVFKRYLFHAPGQTSRAGRRTVGCRRGVLLVCVEGRSLLVAALNLVGTDIDVSDAVAVAVCDACISGKVGLRQALEAYLEWTRVEQRLTGIHGRRPEGDTQVTRHGVDELGIIGHIPHAVDGSGEKWIQYSPAFVVAGIQCRMAEILDDAVLRLNRSAGRDRPSVDKSRTTEASINGAKGTLRVVGPG